MNALTVADRGVRAPASRRRGVARWAVRGAFVVAGGLLTIAIALATVTAWRVVLVAFIAILVGSALNPLVGRMRLRTGLGRRLPRGAAIVVVYGVFFAGVLILGLIILPGALQQVDELTKTLPTALARLRQMIDALQPPALAASLRALLDAGEQAVQPAQPIRAGDVVAAGLTVADLVFTVVTVLTLVYFWLTERPRLQRFVLSFLPADRRSGVRRTWNAIEGRLGAWLRGQLVLMGMVASMASAAYMLLGVPSALLLGLIAGLAEAIPIIGPLLGAIPAVLMTAVLRPDLLLGVLVAYTLIQVLEGNVFLPLVMRNAVGVSPFLTVISLLAGGAIGGLAGALIAVPLAAALVVVLERLQVRVVPVVQEASAQPAVPVADVPARDAAEGLSGLPADDSSHGSPVERPRAAGAARAPQPVGTGGRAGR